LENADKRLMQGGCGNLLSLGKLASRRENRPRRKTIFGERLQNFDRPITLITPFSEEVASGHKFIPRRISEIVRGSVYALSGFEFTEYYFVVSDDRQELIGIDAGTRPDSAKTAYEALRAYAPNLPELTTVFITHSHWDHVWRAQVFRALNPRLHFYARTITEKRSLAAPLHRASQHAILRRTLQHRRRTQLQARLHDRASHRVEIGGTRIELIPVQGGETHDAMLIHLPDQGVYVRR